MKAEIRDDDHIHIIPQSRIEHLALRALLIGREDKPPPVAIHTDLFKTTSRRSELQDMRSAELLEAADAVLSIRAYRVIEHLVNERGVVAFDGLGRLRFNDLLAVENCGKKTALEIQKWMHDHGYTLIEGGDA